MSELIPFWKTRKFLAYVCIVLILGSFGFLVWQHQAHTARAMECKEHIIAVLEANNRTLIPTKSYGLKFMKIVDLSYCFSLFYLFTENKTVYYECMPDVYWFWVESNQTAYLFDTWSYTG